ncbi:hypothetical protein PXD04_10305 [Methanosphaera sp. ISO3-F5]|uniref:hypothetical protein n=1 Tax=Methanosphaera sp. ISO3-F5 TaxID=1452353 RepID=UPI002B262750|nr:hypothetical protein [Methanosphaera sp. ISO3-F5]WQH64082.1 hypothetical protein PXD04_10305 [Methanosphaera sp. ISO3-F5]
MPNFNIIKTSTVPDGFRTKYVIGKFDLDVNGEIKEIFKGSIPFENMDWQIGLIVGGSGTGKSTIAKELFPKQYKEDNWGGGK